MRLLSLNVRNYRIHRDLTLDFDPSRNLIGGTNETGKSTLAEAIHRALFMRHRAGGDLLSSVPQAVSPSKAMPRKKGSRRSSGIPPAWPTASTI